MIIKTKSKEYKIEICSTESFDEIAKSILQNITLSNCVIITEAGVPANYSENLRNALVKNNVEVYKITLDSIGEKNKEFSVAQSIMSEIFQKTRVTRDLCIIALGGGVIGDLSGFIASIIMRGVKFIQIPTTLLAMVDSSIGGKTGINGFGLKNVIGSFYQPDFVLMNTFFLKTISNTSYLGGYCEILKHSFITNDNGEFFSALMENENKIINRDAEFMNFMIKKSSEIKANIVSQDENETLGIRNYLNFGHTIGHAIEKLPEFDGKIEHGIAVALGMVYELKIGMAMKLIANTSMLGKLENHMQNLKLPTKIELNDDKIAIMLQKMTFDKKNVNNSAETRISFSMPFDIGNMNNISVELNELRRLLNTITK